MTFDYASPVNRPETCRGQHTPLHTHPAKATCLCCFHWRHTPDYRQRHGGNPAEAIPCMVGDVVPPALQQSLTACVHRGDKLPERGKCATCKGDRFTDLFSCSVYGTCHRDELTVEGVRACRGCRTRKPPAPGPRVLFASHDLSLTGAPIILANYVPKFEGVRATVYSPVDGPAKARFRQAGVRVIHELPAPEFDLVVANTIARPTRDVVRWALDCGLPVVWLVHESDPSGYGGAEVFALMRHTKVVFACEPTAEVYPAVVDDRTVIPAVIPAVPKRTPNKDSVFTVLTCGDHPRKGTDDLRGAVKLMGDRVRLHVLVDDPDPYQAYADADVYVCPSYVESLPLSIMEAKAYRLPVVTTDVFGCGELIQHNVNGLVYKPGDVEQLYRCLRILQKHPDVRRRLGDAPVTAVPEFDKTVKMYERVFGTAIKRLPVQGVRVVYHTAAVGAWWKDVVKEQLDQFAAAGLRAVYGSHVGPESEWVATAATKSGLDYRLEAYNPDVRNYENPAMLLVRRLAGEGDAPILYTHAKGTGHDPKTESEHHDWRRLMMQEVVGKWRENVRHLVAYDAVGVNWWDKKDQQHFSGTFWMATAAYLRSLPDYRVVYRDRFSAETYIGVGNRCRAYSLLCTNKKFWSPDQDREFMRAALRRPVSEEVRNDQAARTA